MSDEIQRRRVTRSVSDDLEVADRELVRHVASAGVQAVLRAGGAEDAVAPRVGPRPLRLPVGLEVERFARPFVEKMHARRHPHLWGFVSS